MSSIKLLKEPGFIYDLIFVFYLKFNAKQYLNRLDPSLATDEAKRHFQEVSDHFGEIPDDLYVFFHARENDRSFLPTYYFSPYKELFTAGYDIHFLINELSDKERLIKNIVRFYFFDLSEQEIEQCCGLRDAAFSRIKDSEYTPEEKRHLYEFFIDPDSHIQTLQLALMGKKLLLDQYYEKHYQEIIDNHISTTFETLCERVKKIKDLEYLKEEQLALYTSYCLLNKYCLHFFGIEIGAIYLLGNDYLSSLEFLNNSNEIQNLQEFGRALNDESRISILQLLLEREELTRKDLELLFNFSGSTAYHHVTLMQHIGLIKARNCGRTIVYRLNHDYFDSLIDSLNKFTNKKFTNKQKR